MSVPGPRPQNGRRKGRRAALAALLAGTAALGLLAVTLPGLAESQVQAALRAAGWEQAEVALDRLGLTGAEAAVRLSGDQGVDRVSVAYSPGGLLAGRIDRVTLVGARLRLAADAGGIRLEGRAGDEATAGEASGGLPALPVDRIVIERGSLTVATPAGETVLSLSATLDQPDPGGYVVDALLGLDIAGAAGLGTLSARLAPDGALAGELDIQPAPGDGAGSMSGSAELSWRPGGLPEGRARVQVRGAEVRLPERLSLDLDWRGAGSRQELAAVLRAPGGTAVQVTGSAAPGPDGAPAFSALADLTFPDLAGALALAGLDLPVRGRALLSLCAAGPLDGSVPPLELALRGDRLGWPGVTDAATVEAAGRLRRDGGALLFEATTEATAELAPAPDLATRLPEALRGDGPWFLALRPGTDPAAEPLRLRFEAGGEGATLALTGGLGAEIGQAVLGGGIDRLELRLRDGGLAGATLALSGGRIELPPYGGVAAGVTLTADYRPGEGTPPLRVEAAASSLRAGPGTGWVAPLSVTATAGGDPLGRLDFTAEGQGAEGFLVIDATGAHDVASGTGSAKLVLHPLRFREGGRTPAELFPVLSGTVEEARGRIGLRAGIGWGPKASKGSAELLLDDLTLAGPSFRAQGVNGVLTASSLRPLATPGEQLLSAALLDVGLPLTDGLIRFGLAGGKTLTLAQASFAWAGGTVSAAPVTASLSAPRHELALEARGLRLGEVLGTAGVEGLAGSGILNGRIPVIVSGSRIRFEGGRLEAEAPGTLRYDPAVPPDFLDASKNENTALVMQVLEDFHYQQLGIGIDGTVGGEMRVTLNIRGANPEFYGGYPVALNLNLSGALDTILRSGLGAYRIPDAVKARIEQYGKAQ